MALQAHLKRKEKNGKEKKRKEKRKEKKEKNLIEIIRYFQL